MGIAVLVLVGSILFIISILKYLISGNHGKNPFTLKSIHPPQHVVIDHKIRKKVLKPKFNVAQVPTDLDAIVIGSGAGGLGCASILSKAGKKVLVLEQLNKLGGCCHTFIEKGREYDVGIHYIGEMASNTLMRNLSDQVTNGQLDWEPLQNAYDNIVMDDTGEKIPVADRKSFMSELKKEFPEESDNIDRFFNELESEKTIFTAFAMAKALPWWLANFLVWTGLLEKLHKKFYSVSKFTVWERVCQFTDNQRLRTALVYLFMDYGTNPESAAWLMHSMILRHYKYGGYYPRGGASEIPFTMVPVIENAGGKVMSKAKVEEIIVKEGRAVGVRVNQHEIYAKMIISDAGVANTFGKLLPGHIAGQSRYLNYLNEVGSGESVMQVFIGLRGTAEELGIKSTNYWVFSHGENWNKDLKTFLSHSLDEIIESDISIPLMFISFPSTKDPTWNEKYPGTSTCIVAGPARFDWYTEWKEKKVKKRGDEYDRGKNVLGYRLWGQAMKLFPHLEDKVESIEVGTPLTNVHYLAAPSGEIYGLDHNCPRFRSDVVAGLRPDTDVPGLYLTGQDVAVCGFAGALMGSLLCASKILNRNLLDDLIKVKKQRENHKKID